MSSVTYRLVDRSKNILVEKPAGLNFNDITDLYLHSYQKNMNVYVAYNRRFYSSVLKAMEIINDDGGVNSFNFEFTEWAHIIENINQSEEVKKNWFLANSTHVIDLAFYIGGKPQKICCYTSGSLNWHPKAAVFSGAGETKNGILFNYQANWNAPGRWGVEVLTKFHRIILQPLEKLKVQEKGSVIIKDVDIDDIIDIDYKPGLYRQVKNFLGNNFENILSLSDHVMNCEYYKKILGE